MTTLYFLIDPATKSIAGSTDQRTPVGNLELYPGPNLPIDQLYFDGIEVKQKPQQPSPSHYWNLEAQQWVLPVAAVPAPPLRWDTLLRDLEAITSAWNKVVSASEESLKANTAFTMLMSVILSLKDASRLESGFERLRVALTETPAGDFTKAEIVEINKALAKNNFTLELQ